MTPILFSSSSHYMDAFHEGLIELLNHDSLGTLILVCANATFDPLIFDATHSALLTQFERLRTRYTEELKLGHQIKESDEDLLVFLKMASIGFENLSSTAFRKDAEWEIQFNHVRAFRPQRMSGQVATDIKSPFNQDGFHFNKPFMQKECFWQGILRKRSVSLFYNKYPFIEYHGLLLPDREKSLPQFLQKKYHHYVWQLAEEMEASLDGVGFGYNAYGAHASVNHLHFQMFLRPEGLPVMQGKWQHNGGNIPYPVQCENMNNCEQSWEYIEALHAAKIPYNLIYLPGKILIFPRQFQGSFQQSDWSGGFSWYEMGGGTITFNRQDYQGLVKEDILEEFKKLRLNNEFMPVSGTTFA